MIKKILLGSVLVGLVGLLVFGAVNRTIAKSGEELSRFEDSQGAGEGEFGQGHGGRSGGGRGQRSWSEYGQGVRDNLGSQLGIPDPQANAGDWETMQGTVVSLDSYQLLLEGEDGSQVIIEGRAWVYALEQNFTTSVGNTLVVEGFHEDGEYKPARIDDLTAGTSILLRNQSGRPAWAGNGWGAGSSEGNG